MKPDRAASAEPAPRATDESIARVFDADVDDHGGYRYSSDAPLSSRLATQRMVDACLEIADFHGRRVLDVGCGDGVFTFQMYDRAAPESVVAVDLAERALASARSRVGQRRIVFAPGNATSLDFPDDSFDLAWFLGVLHHVSDPARSLREALRVARQVVVLEPNGYSPILKLLEKYSRYHVEHHEKSYTQAQLARWVRDAGGEVTAQKFVGLVPMFCPAWMARGLRLVQPVLEAMPLLRRFGCAQTVFVAQRVEASRVVRT